MTLFEQIKVDQLVARKSNNKLAASLLTTLIGEASAIGKNNGNRDVTDAEVVALVKKFVKGMDETLSYLGNNNDEATKMVLREKKILDAYLPNQMDEAALTQAILDIMVLSGANVGKIMGALKAKFAGQYDGKMASEIIKDLT